MCCVAVIGPCALLDRPCHWRANSLLRSHCVGAAIVLFSVGITLLVKHNTTAGVVLLLVGLAIGIGLGWYSCRPSQQGDSSSIPATAATPRIEVPYTSPSHHTATGCGSADAMLAVVRAGAAAFRNRRAAPVSAGCRSHHPFDIAAANSSGCSRSTSTIVARAVTARTNRFRAGLVVRPRRHTPACTDACVRVRVPRAMDRGSNHARRHRMRRRFCGAHRTDCRRYQRGGRRRCRCRCGRCGGGMDDPCACRSRGVGMAQTARCGERVRCDL
jgi:hypothetical protein